MYINFCKSTLVADEKRNPNIVPKFLTPFLEDSNTLKTRCTTYNIDSFKVSEYIKSEKYYK